MREFAALNERVEALEKLYDLQQSRRRSIRPTVERVGSTAIIAGIVAGILQAVAQLFR